MVWWNDKHAKRCDAPGQPKRRSSRKDQRQCGWRHKMVVAAYPESPHFLTCEITWHTKKHLGVYGGMLMSIKMIVPQNRDCCKKNILILRTIQEELTSRRSLMWPWIIGWDGIAPYSWHNEQRYYEIVYGGNNLIDRHCSPTKDSTASVVFEQLLLVFLDVKLQLKGKAYPIKRRKPGKKTHQIETG